MAILIAVVTLVGAWIGWRIASSSSSSGDARVAGLNAALNVESTLTLNSIALYKDYRVYTNYAHHQTLASLQAEVGASAPFSTTAQPAGKSQEEDLAAEQLPFFLARYLTRDGSYDTRRQLGEMWAETGQRIDLVPMPHFAEAEKLQRKLMQLSTLFIVLAVALASYTLAQGLHRQRRYLRYSMALLGTLALGLAVGATFWIDRI